MSPTSQPRPSQYQPGHNPIAPDRVATTEELQLSAIAATAPMLAISGAVLCLGVVACFWSTIPEWLLASWGCVTFASLLPTPILLYHFDKRSLAPSQVKRLRHLVVTFSVIRALAWGLGAAVFYQYASPAQLALLSVLVVGNAMGTGAALMVIPAAAILFGLSMVGPLALALIASFQTDHIFVGSLMLIFVAGLRTAAGKMTEYIGKEADFRRILIEHQQALVRAKIEADSANRTKSDFLAHMSHELRTPLNAIIGFSEIIASEAFGPVGVARYADYSKDIHTSGRHLLQLINEILDLSKVEAGALTIDEAIFSVQDLLQSVERLVQQRAVSKSLIVTWKVEPIELRLKSDERIVKQILINLVTNAVKFTPAGGSISVRTSQSLDGTCVVSVSDTGIGMHPGDIQNAMQPFGQVSHCMTARAEGTGLGLPLCDRFAIALGGSLAVESTIGQGTNVILKLPAACVVTPISGASANICQAESAETCAYRILDSCA